MDEPKTDNEQKTQPTSDIEPPEQIKAQLKPQDHPEPESLPEHVTEQPLPQTEQLILPPKSRAQAPIITAIIVLLAAMAATTYLLVKNKQSVLTNNTPQPSQSIKVNNPPAPKIAGIQLDPAKNYGDKYAGGILPVGDKKYSSAAPAIGTIYTCQNYVQNLIVGQGGAITRGPWFVGATQYDITKKTRVQGSVTWPANLTNKLSGAKRVIATNGLPDHQTGVFPVPPADPSYAYDRNPNPITGQSLTYNLNASPIYSIKPNCMGAQSGVMLTGAALLNGLDAAGRDAGAWEIQDNCAGHPQKQGQYHYHTLSACIKDTGLKTVVGFALDGFPITGPRLGPNNTLTTADLDECHGLTSQVVLDGKAVTSYHYVMTQDFPYSVSCFRGLPVQPPAPQSSPARQ